VGRLWDVLTILSILVWLLPLAARGLIGADLLAIAFALLVILLAVGRARGGGLSHVVRFCLRVGLPIVSLLTFAIVIGEGDLEAAGQVIAGTAVLIVAGLGLYIIVWGTLSRR
jgi:hypothetical protein